VSRRAGGADDDVEVRLVGRADGEPAIAAEFIERGVLTHLQAQLLRVKGLRLVLIGHEDVHV
jgi:hypothetical protein